LDESVVKGIERALGLRQGAQRYQDEYQQQGMDSEHHSWF
jgi:hypothetical protein